MDKVRHWFAVCTLLVFLPLVQNNAVQESMCKVSCYPKHTEYVVYTMLRPDEYDCLYSWNNYTDFVLASAQGHVDLVQTHTNTTLVLFEAMNVVYELNCMSGSTRETRHRTTCFANCSDKSQSPIDSSSVLSSVSSTISIIIAKSFFFEWF
ncbi:hypothetical protein NL108_006181 [Boleophthalmus pectinirostris]|nr:hypothetical protein NL108_006181 [Boleophthalmus pectinirostris]